MSQNAVAALEASFKTWKERRFPEGGGKLDLHEYYCIEQFTRPYTLTDTELRSGMIGGSQDGGVDAFYILANNELVTSEYEPDPKDPPAFRVLIMQIKSDEGFSPVAIDKLNWFLRDLLDISRKKSDYHTAYRDDLIRLMRLFKDKYGLVMGDTPPLQIECIYVIKKQVKPNDDCMRSEAAVRKTVGECFKHADLDLKFINAAGLWTQVQSRPPLERTLRWALQPMQTPEGDVGLVKLKDYKAFITDPGGRVAERFFDSNVRGYWPNKDVNKSIAATLENAAKSPEFWLLNNGITILADKVDAGAYLEISIKDPQIVNGLQTSRQLFGYYEANPAESSDNRRVLVRVIKAAEDARDEIIRCTNSQNQMPPEALRGTDAIHRQIETVFLADGLYYDRRKGHHRDQGKPVSQIVDVIEVLQAMLSIVLLAPDDARARPRDYIKKDALYTSIFGEKAFPLTLYLRATQISRRVTEFLESQDLEAIHRRNIYFYLCMYAACVLSGSAYANPGKIQAIDVSGETSPLTDSFLTICYQRVWKVYEHLAEKDAEDGERDYDALAKGPNLLKALRAGLKRRFNPPKKNKK